MALTTAKHICRMPCCVLLLLYCTMDPKIYLKLHFEFFKTFYCPGDFCTNLFVGMQEGPSGPKPQIKQTNKQTNKQTTNLFLNFFGFFIMSSMESIENI